jgi:hypothetical protein
MACDGGHVCQASQIPEDLWSVTAHTPAIMPQHGRECRGGVPGNGWPASQRSVHEQRPHEPHARGTRPTISAVCLCVSMRSVLLRHAHAVRPVALGVQACLHCGVPLPALRHSAEHGRDHAYLLQRPQSPSMCRSPHAGALRLSLVLIRSAPSIRVYCHPLQPLSEEKAVRGFIIDIVDEKNQKNEKVLTGKTGP